MPPPQEVVVGDGTTIEDVRAIMQMANAKNPGASFQFMRRQTWLDGSRSAWTDADAGGDQQRHGEYRADEDTEGAIVYGAALLTWRT